MATETETAASYHTSTTETFEKKVDENEGKHDMAEEAPGQATPLSKTEGEAEGYDKKKAKHAVVEAEKFEDSPSLEATPEDNLEHDKVEDAQGTTDTEGEEKPPAVVAVEKIDGSMSSEASVADDLKGEKELILDSHTISVTEPAPDADTSQPEEPPPTESTETDEEKQPNTANIPEASVAETIEELSNTAETNPLTESEVEVVKETEHLETSSQKIDKPEHAVTEGKEKSEEPENEFQDKAQDAEQPNTVEVSNPSAETNEKPGDAMVNPETVVQEVHEKSEEREKESQEKTQEVEQPTKVAFPDSSGETNEILSDAIGNREPVAPELHKNSEPRKESQEKQQEAEQPDTVAVSDPLDETNEKLGDATGKHDSAVAEMQKKSEELEKESKEKPQGAEQPKTSVVSDPSAETNENLSEAIEKPEPIVAEVHEKSEETQKESQENPQEAEQPKPQGAEQPKTSVVSDPSAETNENLSEAIEKPEPIVAEVHEKSEETQKESQENPQEAEQPNTVEVSDPSAENNEKLIDVIEKSEPIVTKVHEKAEETEEESEEKQQEAEQPKTIEVSDPLAETNEKLSDATEKTDPIVTEIHEKTEETEKESQENPQEVEQPKTAVVSDLSAETNEKLIDAIEKVEPIVTEVHEKSEETKEESKEKPQKAEQPKTSVVSDPSAETNENLSDVTEKTEPTVTEVHEKSEETQKESQENPKEAEQPNTIAVSDSSVETNEKLSDASKKTEPIVTDIHEKSEEKEKESQEKPQDAEQPKTFAIPDPLVETSEKLNDVMEEKTRDPKCDDELSKVSGNYEAVPTEAEEAEHLITEIKENPSEPEKQSFEKEKEEQLKTVIHQTEPESADKPGDIVEVHPPQKSDIEAVKESGNSNSEAVPTNIEKPELVSTEVEEKDREQLETSEIVHETAMSKETSDDTIKGATSLQVEKTEKTEETIITGNSALVSLNEEAQAATANLVESSPAFAERVAEEDGKEEASCTKENEMVSKEVVDILKDPEQAFIKQEVKTDPKEGTECSAPISIEEKVAANDDKGSSREAKVEIKKVEEQNEAMTGDVKAESVKDDRAAVDEEKQGHPETKVEIKETLASKLEEKEEESIKTGVDNQEKVPTKESDVTKTSKATPTPVKPTQKQANNIIAKVKQTLLKAKKAITGKSPTTSKTISSQAKGDIQVK